MCDCGQAVAQLELTGNAKCGRARYAVGSAMKPLSVSAGSMVPVLYAVKESRNGARESAFPSRAVDAKTEEIALGLWDLLTLSQAGFCKDCLRGLQGLRQAKSGI